MTTDNPYAGLNPDQLRAVEASEGRVRVVAGAGSGKTRVLAHRFAFLINEIGVSPGNVLCLTFTNKAAQEMKQRIARMVDRGSVSDFICTARYTASAIPKTSQSSTRKTPRHSPSRL